MLAFAGPLVRAKSLQQVWSLLSSEMALYGFDRLIYGFTRFATPNGVGALEDALFLTSHDRQYFNRFIGDRMFLHAPLTRWVQENKVGSCSWGALWTKPEDLRPEERDVVAFNIAMGVTAGYTIAVPTPSPRSYALFALTGMRGLTQKDLDETWAAHGPEIEVKCNLAHLKIASLPIDTARTKLSRRQLEVLEWVALGKSNQDVATIMGVSVPTVEKHLRNAREKLVVDTTAQAVAKLTFLNQMYVSATEGTEMDLNREAGDSMRRLFATVPAHDG
ncbi:LuxR family transcriptional regulator [Maritimibacter sp. DP1N21-5]|uniref:helix-turn-helix transcriptional regulator n=1 Tax=Maritimibacter sp. DP1N21-5 TaxID=2836867 RepID=UPI001C43B0CC|nr:LuxR family transcriptional regulator [Maritimibacter sp. DP1N21-5]MBV7409838.1 LuxR family transcriptional regulator [Maritimibacter sp. DP1N21-5]